MSAGVRRSLALSLAGGAVLLLLLLARLPPAPRDAQPVLLALPARDHPPASLAHADTHSVEPAPSTPHDKPSSPSSQPPAASVNVTSSPRAPPPPPPPAPANTAGPRVVYTKELYEGGHLWPKPERCPALGSGVTVLILITSAPSHSAARDAIRYTWGHFASRRDVAMAFVLGRPQDAFMENLVREDELYGDLIIGNSMDSYSNLTLKTLSMLEWADTYCPRAHTLLKTDDDMFINVPKLLQFINATNRINATKTMYGKLVKKNIPNRISKSKYFLSRVQYPGKVLPDFLTGPAYLMTRDCIRPLYLASGSKPYVRLEDVFVTGILGNALGIKRQHAHEFYNKKISGHPCAVQRGVAVHMVRYHEQFDLWRKLLDRTAKCS